MSVFASVWVPFQEHYLWLGIQRVDQIWTRRQGLEICNCKHLCHLSTQRPFNHCSLFRTLPTTHTGMLCAHATMGTSRLASQAPTSAILQSMHKRTLMPIILTPGLSRSRSQRAVGCHLQGLSRAPRWCFPSRNIVCRYPECSRSLILFR